MNPKISIAYTDTDEKVIRELINLECDNPGYIDHHMIMFHRCNKQSKKVRKYIEEKGYFYHDFYTSKFTIDGKRIKVVIIVKPLKGMSKEELEQIEGNMVMIKLTQNIIKETNKEYKFIV